MSVEAILTSAVLAQGGGGASSSGGSTMLGLAGMLALFGALVLLAVFTPAIRRLLFERHSKPVPVPETPEQVEAPPTDEEIAAAVCAIHAHLAQIEQIEHLHLTWGLYDKPYKPWRLAGRAEFMLGRQSVQSRPRNRS